MRDLLFEVPEELFADDLGHDLLFRHIGRDPFREHERPFLRKALADLHEAVQPVVPLGADGDDVHEVHKVLIGRDDRQQVFLFHRVDLIDDEDRGDVRLLDLFDELLLLRADVGDRLDEQNDGIDVGDRLVDDVHHIVAELRARAVEARGVDENELRIAAVDDGADAVAGGLRLMGYDGDLLADERVGKRGLADIRPPGDRDHRGFGFHRYLLISAVRFRRGSPLRRRASAFSSGPRLHGRSPAGAEWNGW